MAGGSKVVVSDLAEADIKRIVEFLEEQWSPELAIRFLNNYYRKLDLIESMPGIGFLSHRVGKVRKVKVDKYNVICYEIGNEVITVLRIIDMRSDPDVNPY